MPHPHPRPPRPQFHLAHLLAHQPFPSALLALATAMSFSPGPNTTLSTALAANRGLRGAMHFVCAVPVGWGALLLLCAAGLGAVLTAAPAARLALQLAGLAYLLWLAY